MTMFPGNEKRKIRQKAKLFPIFSAVGSKQFDGCDPFIVMFEFSDIVVQFCFFFPYGLANHFYWSVHSCSTAGGIIDGLMSLGLMLSFVQI